MNTPPPFEMPRRLAHRYSKRGVAMVLLEYKEAGTMRRAWCPDHYDESARLTEARQWRQAEDAAFEREAADELRHMRADDLIAWGKCIR